MKNNYFRLFSFVVLMCSFQMVIGQTQKQQEEITSRYDKEKLNQLKDQFEQKASTEKQRALQIATTKNFPLKIEENGTFAELQRIAEDGSPIYYTTFNVAAAKSTRADHLNSGGSLGLNLDGQNMTGYVWDGGHSTVAHEEFDGPGGNNRVTVEDAASEGGTKLNFHAIHVTGTVTASGFEANAKGMATHAKVRGYMWNNDIAEATAAAGNGMLLSNHSYGFRGDLVPDQYFGAYITESRDWDEVMFNAPNYLMVVAAGNDGNQDGYNGSPLGGNSAYDKLTGHSTSKNNLVVANAQDANIDANGNLVSVTINSSSSEGPTDDLRIKPDITGNGSGVYSSFHFPSWDAATGQNLSDGNINDDHASITGTSMASPNVMGSLLLLQQHTNNVNGSFMKAATLKGLALHTADDAGSNGPDAIFGWGLMNAKRAAEAVTQNGNESLIDERTLTSGQSYSITVDSDGSSPLLASISWTDRAGTATTATNSGTARLVNDLDIRVTKGGTTHSPWRLTGITTNGTGDNTKDPYERVDVASASGTYTITVTHKGSLTGGSQNFSLVVTGLTGTPVQCTATTPTGLNIDGFGSSTATVSWNAVAGTTYDVRHRATGTSSWTTNAVSGTSTSLSGLSAQTQYEVQVRSKCSDGSNSAYSSSATFTTTEVQLNYCASASTNTNDEFISRVQLGSIDNTTGASFYSDFTSQSTNLTKGTSATITVTPTWTGTLYNEAYSVWIDYNKDGDFTDAGEQVWTQAPTQTTPVSGSFTVPTGAVTGATRMRVSMQYNALPTSCQTFQYGEVEDYTVNIGAGTPDTTAPVITLTGASTINLNVGDTYTEQGATATDNIDGNLTSSIVISGTVNTNAAGTYTVNYNVSDAAGNAASQVSRTVNVTVPADTTAPVITLTGASTINLTVGDSFTDPGATATDNVDGNLTSSIVVTGSVNTGVAATYILNYNVSDAAGNAATQVSRTVIVSEPSSGGCSGGVSSFPYSEGFENTLGAWTQSTADDINWDINSSTTPSTGTGPSSANQGTYYIYVEASGNGTGYPNKRAILNSPCFNLSGETEATFSFKYHMNGATDMGTIALEASNDNGTTWTSIWNESGDKADAWLSVDVSLNTYAGGSVQLRFNRVTGSTWQADIAIDDVNVTVGGSTGGSGCSGGISSYPYSEGYENTLGAWTQSTADDINWDINSSTTPSTGTGPSSANQGTYYIYVEASGNGTGYPNKQAILNSPCYNLASASSASFSFNYHMNGAADMGTIALEASNDNGATWTSIWNESGDKANSWLTANVSLNAYVGGGVQLRFNRVTGSTWQADIAIDNVSLTSSAVTSNVVLGDSISDNEGSFELSIYPNPVKGSFLNVSTFTDNVDYSIYNMLGQLVSKGVLDTSRIDVSELKAAIYIVEFSSKEHKITKRFIKE